MSNSSKPTDSSPLPGDDRNVVAAGSQGTVVSFEDQIQAFWHKNSRFILFVIALGFLAIIGREVVTYMWKVRESGISEAYGAADNSAKLKAFAAEHASHKLAGFAWIRLADEAYTAGNYSDAAASYDKAAPLLVDTPMSARARIGSALSQSLGGNRTQGDSALKAITTDLSIMQALRSEARYHLATFAISDGNIEDARKQLDDLAQADLTGMWAQRAFMLRSSLPAEAVVATTPATAPAATTGEVPLLKLNLPGSTP